MYIYIRSMSEAQTDVYRKITAVSDQIILHIAKIALFPDSEYVDHWMHEIWAFLYRVPRLKGNKKFPKYNFLKKCLSTNNDSLQGFIPIAKTLESDLKPNDLTEEQLLVYAEDYEDWLAREFSSKGYVTNDEVKCKLKEMFNM